MVNNHSDCKRKPAAATGATISNQQQGFFHMHHPTDRIAHITAFVIPVIEHWLEQEIAHWVHYEGSIRWPIAPWADALTTELHLAPAQRDASEPCCEGEDMQWKEADLDTACNVFHDVMLSLKTLQSISWIWRLFIAKMHVMTYIYNAKEKMCLKNQTSYIWP